LIRSTLSTLHPPRLSGPSDPPPPVSVPPVQRHHSMSKIPLGNSSSDHPTNGVWGGKETTTFILKPSAGCQGKGVRLLQSLSQYDALPSRDLADDMVAQEYILRPLLSHGRKWDVRVYALILSVAPLEIYVYREGLVRLAKSTYAPPSSENLTAVTMHITNYAVNKDKVSDKVASATSVSSSASWSPRGGGNSKGLFHPSVFPKGPGRAKGGVSPDSVEDLPARLDRMSSSSGRGIISILNPVGIQGPQRRSNVPFQSSYRKLLSREDHLVRPLRPRRRIRIGWPKRCGTVWRI